ncbi:YraN family protein [Pollutimonas bauzanensis]|uniref:UPF0102 protein SAMN04488135_102535 n=1 Tax=Pollutimonas bauzanensis TaxID=658167 RepID=A0A1M5RDT4_9BURK|nr:YraN family protein [Pollutimonas bauzanensis]SHH23963.1 putative endonuclease [Pollutimonas bauzanensis]
MAEDDQRLYETARAAQGLAARKRRRKARAAPRERGAAAREPAAPSAAQRAGRRAEEHARRYLQARGLIILARNLRGRTGEIDLVAADSGVLAFIEVRQRRSRRYGGAAASVNRGKQGRLIRTAQYFLPGLKRRYFGGATPPCRFDIITVEPQGLAWIKDAFRE